MGDCRTIAANKNMIKESTLIAVALLLAIIFNISAIVSARGGERMLCHLEPADADGWHYRTKIGGRPEQCWYQGERMKPRSELYWAETPKVPPPMSVTTPEPEFILRWRGHPQGWDHKE